MTATYKNITEELGEYFSIQELVSKAVWERYGENAWRFLDPRLIHTLLVLRRDILRVPLVCNNWKSGGTLQQRGLRENTSDIVKSKTAKGQMYLSAHTTGQAVDLSSGRMSANDMREAIVILADLLPYPVRIEDGESAPTWLHIDVACPPSQEKKITFFKD